MHLFVVDDTSSAVADTPRDVQPTPSLQDVPSSTGGAPQSTNISKPPTQSSINVQSKPQSPPTSHVESAPPQEDVAEGEAMAQQMAPPKETKPMIGIFLQTAAFLLDVNALQVLYFAKYVLRIFLKILWTFRRINAYLER